MHRYKCWRANGTDDRGDPTGQIHVLCHDGEAFEKLSTPWDPAGHADVALKPRR